MDGVNCKSLVPCHPCSHRKDTVPQIVGCRELPDKSKQYYSNYENNWQCNSCICYSLYPMKQNGSESCDVTQSHYSLQKTESVCFLLPVRLASHFMIPGLNLELLCCGPSSTCANSTKEQHQCKRLLISNSRKSATLSISWKLELHFLFMFCLFLSSLKHT